MADLADWLTGLGLGKYAAAFAEQEIDFDLLPLLTEADVRELGLPIGPRRKLLEAIGALRGATATQDDRPERRSEAERRQLTIMFVDLAKLYAIGAEARSRGHARGIARVSGRRHRRDQPARLCRQADGRRRARVFRLAAGA